MLDLLQVSHHIMSKKKLSHHISGSDRQAWKLVSQHTCEISAHQSLWKSCNIKHKRKHTEEKNNVSMVRNWKTNEHTMIIWLSKKCKKRLSIVHTQPYFSSSLFTHISYDICLCVYASTCEWMRKENKLLHNKSNFFYATLLEYY